MKRLIFLLWMLGCDAPVNPAEDAPFTFGARSEASFTVRAKKSGVALSGLSLLIRSEDGKLLWRGLTQEGGEAKPFFSLPPGQRYVSLIAQRPGLVGPYTDEALRVEQGAFAPSAWIRLPVDELSQLLELSFTEDK